MTQETDLQLAPSTNTFTMTHWRWFNDCRAMTGGNVYLQSHIYTSLNCSGTQTDGVNTQLDKTWNQYQGPFAASAPGTPYGSVSLGYSTDLPNQSFISRIEYGSSSTGPWTTWVEWHITTNSSGTGGPTACTGPPPPPGPCPYGAQPNPSAAVYTFITDALVTAVAAALGMGPMGIVALGVMIGAPITFPTCASVPAIPPALVDADFLFGTGLPNPLSIGKWMQHFTYGVWLFYCQCTPAPSGSPPPTNPPVPVLPPILQPGPQPPSACVNTDVCTTLNHIVNILTTINLSIQNNTYVPAEPAYTYGTLYTGLTGQGEIAVSGILGVFVSLTTRPNRVGGVIGHPSTVFDVGHITFGSPDGWDDPLPITTDPDLMLGTHMTNISKVGYSIPADVVVQLRLLVPVPFKLAAAAGT